MPFLAVPSSMLASPQAEHNSSCIRSSYLRLWMFRALENVTFGKSLTRVRKNIPNKRLLASCLTAILSPLDRVEFHELFFCLRDWKPKFILKPLSLGKEEIYYIYGSLLTEEIVNLSTTASPAQLFRQAHKPPEELFPCPSLRSSQVSPPSGTSREDSEHLSLLVKRQLAFMDVPSFIMCVSFRVFTE